MQTAVKVEYQKIISKRHSYTGSDDGPLDSHRMNSQRERNQQNSLGTEQKPSTAIQSINVGGSTNRNKMKGSENLNTGPQSSNRMQAINIGKNEIISYQKPTSQRHPEGMSMNVFGSDGMGMQGTQDGRSGICLNSIRNGQPSIDSHAEHLDFASGQETAQPKYVKISARDPTYNELFIQDNQLTNIVLDDFRKQVKGLEDQVENQSFGVRSKPQTPNETKGQPVTSKQSQLTPTHGKKLQPQESTDLDDSHPMISMIQARGDTSVMDIITKKGIVTGKQIIVRKNAPESKEKTVAQLLLTESGQPNTKDKIITQHEIDEMRRRMQRRQRGKTSEHNSYIVKLDPNIVPQLSPLGADYPPYQHNPIEVNRAGQQVRLNSMGSVRQGNKMRERMEAQHFVRGQNQFMKSFVQNSKNSSLFNHFLGRCSLGNPAQSNGLTNTTGSIKKLNYFAQVPTEQSSEYQQSFRGQAGGTQRQGPQWSNQDVGQAVVMPVNQAQQPRLSRDGQDETAIYESGFTLNDLPFARHQTEVLPEGEAGPFGFDNPVTTLPLSIMKDETRIEPRFAAGAPETVLQTQNGSTLMKKVEEVVSSIDSQNVKAEQSLHGSNMEGPPSFRQQEPFVATKIGLGGRNDITVTQSNVAHQLPQFSSRDVTLNMSGQTSPNVQNSSQKRVSIPVSTHPLGIFKKKTEPDTATKETASAYQSPKSRKSVGSPSTLNRSSPHRRQTLAALVSAGQLPVVAEQNNRSTRKQSPNRRQPNVNVKIQLAPSTGAACTCDGHHQEQCSESNQMLENINNKFHKQDIKFKLAKNNEERRKFRPGQTSQHARLASQQHSRVQSQQQYRDFFNASKLSKTGNLVVCSCNGLQCCTLDKNPSVEGCLCVVHSFKYQVTSRNQLNALLANADGDSLVNSVEFASQNLSLLPAKRVKKNNRNQTMVQWNQVNPSYTDAANSISNYRSGKSTAGQATRRTRLSLTQILANNQVSSSHSRHRFSLIKPENSTMQGKLLPGLASAQRVTMVDHKGSFDSNIEGARITFIKQLRQSSKEAEKTGSTFHENSQAFDSSTALFGQYASSAEGFPPSNFKQIISEARESADLSSEGRSQDNDDASRQQKPKVLTLDQMRLQSIFSVDNLESKQSKRSSQRRQSKQQTATILQESFIQSHIKDGNTTRSPNLSVKKQLRLQKMALQGIDYRPKPGQQKVFDKGDIKEYFRDAMDRSAIVSNSRNNSQDEIEGDRKILAQESSCIDGSASFISMTDHNQTYAESTTQSVQLFQESKFMSTNDAGPGNAYHDSSEYQGTTASKKDVWKYAKSGAVSFRRDLGQMEQQPTTIKEEVVSSPMSEYVRKLNFKHSKQTEAWLKQDEQKKLEQSQHRIKRLTADPVMTIEQTKAKNNQVMMRKMQKKVKSLNQRRTQRQDFSNQMEYQESLRPIQDKTFYEESLASKRSRQRASNREGYRSYDMDNNQIHSVSVNMAALNNSRQHFVSIDERSGLPPQNHLQEDLCANSRAAGNFEQSSLFRPTQASKQKNGGVQKPTINLRQPVGGALAKNPKSLNSPRGAYAGANRHFSPTQGGVTQDHITLFDGAKLDPVTPKPAKILVEYEIHLNQVDVDKSVGDITVEQPSVDQSNTLSLKKEDSGNVIQMISSAMSTERAPLLKTEGNEEREMYLSTTMSQKKRTSAKKLREQVEKGDDRKLKHTNGEWQALISTSTAFKTENLK